MSKYRIKECQAETSSGIWYKIQRRDWFLFIPYWCNIDNWCYKTVEDAEEMVGTEIKCKSKGKFKGKVVRTIESI